MGYEGLDITFLMRMWLDSKAPVSPPPVKTCTTPFGKPAFSNKGPRASEPNGLFSDGLTIRTFPVARHGAALKMKDATGALYGFTAAHTLGNVSMRLRMGA
jgi:hypothetical protein